MMVFHDRPSIEHDLQLAPDQNRSRSELSSRKEVGDCQWVVAWGIVPEPSEHSGRWMDLAHSTVRCHTHLGPRRDEDRCRVAVDTVYGVKASPSGQTQGLGADKERDRNH